MVDKDVDYESLEPSLAKRFFLVATKLGRAALHK